MICKSNVDVWRKYVIIHVRFNALGDEIIHVIAYTRAEFSMFLINWTLLLAAAAQLLILFIF